MVIKKRFMKRVLFVALCMATLASCSSMQVATNVLKQYPVTTAPEDVLVYEDKADAPSYAEFLGQVKVYDKGNARTEPWDTTLLRAKAAVSEVGGNSLCIVSHVKPSIWGSTNHQLIGTMLLCPEDSTAKVEYSFSNWLDEMNAEIEKYKEQEFKGHSIFVSANYAMLASEYDLGDDATWLNGNIKNGYEVEAGYEYTSPSGFGFGILGSSYNSSADVALTSDGIRWNGHINLNLKDIMGTLSFVESSEKLMTRGGFGIGYVVATENLSELSGTAYSNNMSYTYSKGGPGICAFYEISYRFSYRTSLGARFKVKRFTYKEKGDDNIYGYETVGVGLVFRQAF